MPVYALPGNGPNTHADMNTAEAEIIGNTAPSRVSVSKEPNSSVDTDADTSVFSFAASLLMTNTFRDATRRARHTRDATRPCFGACCDTQDARRVLRVAPGAALTARRAGANTHVAMRYKE